MDLRHVVGMHFAALVVALVRLIAQIALGPVVGFVGSRLFARHGQRQCLRWHVVCLVCAGQLAGADLNQAHAEPTSPLSILLNGKHVQVRVCNDPIVSRSVCEEIASAITHGHPALLPLHPESEVPNSNDNRVNALGLSCAPSGADIKGDPYLPFELEFDGWQAVPSGPFQVFSIGEILPKWRDHKIVAATGYHYESARLSAAHPLSWKGFYAVRVTNPCPVALLAALYHRGREQASPQRVRDDLVVWDSRILLVSVEEQSLESDSYYVNVLQLPEDPVAGEAAGGVAATHILSFIAH